jgi:hypothetical protein
MSLNGMVIDIRQKGTHSEFQKCIPKLLPRPCRNLTVHYQEGLSHPQSIFGKIEATLIFVLLSTRSRRSVNTVGIERQSCDNPFRIWAKHEERRPFGAPAQSSSRVLPLSGQCAPSRRTRPRQRAHSSVPRLSTESSQCCPRSRSAESRSSE